MQIRRAFRNEARRRRFLYHRITRASVFLRERKVLVIENGRESESACKVMSHRVTGIVMINRAFALKGTDSNGKSYSCFWIDVPFSQNVGAGTENDCDRQ